jgi:hypothetical protein
MNLQGAAKSPVRSFSPSPTPTWLLGSLLGLVAVAAGAGCGSSEAPHGAPVLESVYWELIGAGAGADCVVLPSDAGDADSDAGDALGIGDGVPKNQCLVWSKDAPGKIGTVPPAAAQFNLVFDRVLDGAKIEDTITDGGITRQYPKLSSTGVNVSPVTWDLDPDGASPKFSLVVWYNSLSLPFTAVGSAYIYGRARSDDQPADAPNPTLTFPPSNTVTLTLDKTRITSQYNEPMVGPDTITVNTAPFSLLVSLPKPPPGGSISYAPINYRVPLEFNNRIGDPANHIQVVQNGRSLRSEEYQLVPDPTVPTKFFVRPINVRTNPPAAGDRTTRPRWDSNACVEVTVAADLTDVYDVALGVATTAVFIAGDPSSGGTTPDAGAPTDGGTTGDAGGADVADPSDSGADAGAGFDAPVTSDAPPDVPVTD